MVYKLKSAVNLIAIYFIFFMKLGLWRHWFFRGKFLLNNDNEFTNDGSMDFMSRVGELLSSVITFLSSSFSISTSSPSLSAFIVISCSCELSSSQFSESLVFMELRLEFLLTARDGAFEACGVGSLEL